MESRVYGLSELYIFLQLWDSLGGCIVLLIEKLLGW